MSFKTWDFTIFDYERYGIIDFIKNDLEWNRCVCSEEVCPTTGNMHLQGRITWKRTYRLAAILKLFGQEDDPDWIKNVTFDKSISTRDWNYYKKLGGVRAIDEDKSKQGKRTDLEDCYNAYIKGDKKAIMENYLGTFIRNNKHISSAFGMLKEPRKEPPQVFWLYGVKGSGKTRFVIEKEPDLWLSSGGLRWFDGYMNQEAVCLDDFRATQCEFEFFLRLIDRYPMRVEYKGGSIEWTPKRIYITSIFDPERAFALKTSEDLGQVTRRITEVNEFTLDT